MLMFPYCLDLVSQGFLYHFSIVKVLSKLNPPQRLKADVRFPDIGPPDRASLMALVSDA